MIAQAVFLVALLVVAHSEPLGLGAGGYGLGLGLGAGGLGNGIGIGGSIGIGAGGVDLYAPPRYEYNYAVRDAHTGDQKDKVESRIGDLTRTDYAWAQGDRAIRVSKVIAGGHAIGLGGY